MTETQFISDLKSFRNGITSFRYLNIESPKRLQFLINEITVYLNDIETDETLKNKINACIEELNLAYLKAENLSKTLKLDISKLSDNAIVDNEETTTAWAIQVIGTGE